MEALCAHRARFTSPRELLSLVAHPSRRWLILVHQVPAPEKLFPTSKPLANCDVICCTLAKRCVPCVTNLSMTGNMSTFLKKLQFAGPAAVGIALVMSSATLLGGCVAEVRGPPPPPPRAYVPPP